MGFGPSLVHCRRVVPQPLLMPLISAAGLAEFLPLLLRRRLLQQPVPPRNFLLGRRRRRLHGFARAPSPRRFPVPGRMRAAQNVSEKEEQLQPEFLASNAKHTACVDEFAAGWALGYGITHDKQTRTVVLGRFVVS